MLNIPGHERRGAQPWPCAIRVYLEKPSRMGKKGRQNIAEDDDGLAGQRAAPVQEVLDFIFLSLFSSLSHTSDRSVAPHPRRAARWNGALLTVFSPTSLTVQFPCFNFQVPAALDLTC